MKLKLSFIFIAFLIINDIQSQSVPSFWMNIYSFDDYHDTRKENVEKIIVKRTGYYSSGKSYKEKWEYNFREKNKCDGKLFKDGELNSYFSYEYDSLNQKIKSITKSKIPSLGWEKQTIEYKYIDGRRLFEKHFDGEYNLVRNAVFEYDSLKYLIKLSVNDTYETADYNYKTDSYVYKVFNQRGELVLEKENFAHLNRGQEIRNEFGDLIQVIWPTANPINNVYHIMEYKYDKKGNWIKRKRYIVENGKSRVKSKITRKIKYK